MAAGAAGLRTLVTAQSYASAPVSLIVGDILNAAGEKLAASSMSLAARFAWTRFGVDVSAGAALQAVVDELGAVWRALPDGTIWIGTETWPPWTVTNFDVTDVQPEDGRLELVTDTPTLLPGMSLPSGDTFTGGNVGRVLYRIASDAIRVEVFFE
jgi:hypothetical protein